MSKWMAARRLRAGDHVLVGGTWHRVHDRGRRMSDDGSTEGDVLIRLNGGWVKFRTLDRVLCDRPPLTERVRNRMASRLKVKP